MGTEERLLRTGDPREITRHNQSRVDYDDYSVRLFPEEAPTEAKRYAANTFVQDLYGRVWSDTGWGQEDEPTLISYVTAEWVKQAYEEYIRDGLSWRPYSRDGHPLDPRFALEHAIGETLRQTEKTQWMKTQYDPNTVLGRANLQCLDHTEAVYNNILGLVEQAIQLDAPPGPAPSLPGPAPLLGK